MKDFTRRPANHPVVTPKLIRDNIPDFHRRDKCHSVTRIISDRAEFERLLFEKLKEEVTELSCSDSPADGDEECADILEVLRTIAKLRGLELPERTSTQLRKYEQLGGFERRLLLTEFEWGPSEDVD